MTKIAGSGDGSIRQRHGSADPYQNVTDPQHWLHQSTQESTQVKEGYFQGTGIQ
jgi:hypothetical protein